MPTQHIEPASDDLLQHVAEALLKARKVVVVTGAGISTNSGIPDFRSENGLYSLIQAQFDAAARQARPVEASSQSTDSDKDDGSEQGRPAKRRKLFPGLQSPALPFDPAQEDTKDEIKVRVDTVADTIVVSDSKQQDEIVVMEEEEQKKNQKQAEATAPPREPDQCRRNTTMLRRTRSSIVVQPTTSPLSSPPPEDFILTPCVSSSFRAHAHLHQSSSPLSSPPPNLFDPFVPSSPSDSSSSAQTNASSGSESGEPPQPNPFSSQASSSGKTSLPNMKGKDLFDAAIWADPLRTSVFYTFATTLRQKIRDIEPTASHHFISHLRDRGKLVRCYTQNIDQIEEKVGLSTRLTAGPGSRGRFSRRSTANAAQLSRMVEEVSESKSNTSDNANGSQADDDSERGSQTTSPEHPKPEQTPVKRPPSGAGVECVFLHGSLEQLRCFLCGRVCSWDDANRESETMSGQQPECPHCVGATAAREERGKRALGVGKLRPDIVLYGEEHPSAHLISPIITHDLALQPDMLLILGTSLRVHGLKVMVREFAKAVHTRGGTVVFVNFTKPPESSWGDIIDYWVQWDCDAWVDNLQGRIPKLWQALEPPKPKKKRELTGNAEDGETKRPPPLYPVAMRDTKATGAYWSMKIIQELHRITNTPTPAPLPPKAPTKAPTSTYTETAPPPPPPPPPSLTAESPPDPPPPAPPTVATSKPKRPRKSAPGALDRPRKPSTLNPKHGRSHREAATTATDTIQLGSPQIIVASGPANSILDAVKSKARVRKRKMIDGEEVIMPKVGTRRATLPGSAPPTPDGNNSIHVGGPPEPPIHLAPLNPQFDLPSPSIYGRPLPMEPPSPPAVPLWPISANLNSARLFGKQQVFYYEDALLHRPNAKPPFCNGDQVDPQREEDAAFMLAALRDGSISPVVPRVMASLQQPQQQPHQAMDMEGKLMDWGSTWKCSSGSS
ncbi:hypothetical protein S40293_09763 [Stachybotrys chartarum IBT 40293]|nr:hypothetical protein S40293_09763 [Stachybotrys chartarum IBT 40293]